MKAPQAALVGSLRPTTHLRCPPPIRTTRPFTSSPSRLAYRPPILPDADLPLGEAEEPQSERLKHAKLGFRMFIKYCAWGFAMLGVGTLGLFEGTHWYIEWYKLPPTSDYPSSASSSSSRSPASSHDEVDPTDPEDYGWDDELVSWTGGHLGGTSPKLGYKGRHALRAAWMALYWNTTLERSAVPQQGLFEPDFMLLKRLESAESHPAIQADKPGRSVDAYLTTALDVARSKGMVFPPELSITRLPGPPPPPTSRSTVSTTVECDPVVRDLLLLKASNLERISSPSSLIDTKEIYERILFSTSSDRTPRQEARVMRLAKKVGDLCQRIGADQEGLQWYGWGLARTGIQLDGLAAKKSSWLGSSDSSDFKLPVAPSSTSPALLRAEISLLTAAETYYATHAQLPAASNIQSAALTLIPTPSGPLSPPTKDNAEAVLHQTWLANRQAMLNLHRASVAHAQRDTSALSLAETASAQADRLLPLVEPLSPIYIPAHPTALAEPARQLHRDSILLAAESSFTLGRLIETSRRPDLERVARCFERAADLDARQSGRTEESTMGNEWHKYWRNYVRTKAQLGEAVESPFTDKEVEWKGRDEMILDALSRGVEKFISFFETKR